MMGTKMIRKIGMSVAAQQVQMTKPKKSSHTLESSIASEKKKELDYDYFLNSVSKRRRPSMLREINYIMSKMPSDTILFGVGIPNVDTFPFQSININLKNGLAFNLEGKDLQAALQYLPSRGYLPLVQKLHDLIDRSHGKQDWEKRAIMVTAGAQEGLCIAIEMSLNEGDPIIIPSPMYAGTVDLFKPYLPRVIAVPQDKDGLIPDLLYKELIQAQKDGTPLPKLMYTNPTACNPTGVNISDSRKREIYQLACEYNFLILEDDPYYFLHFQDENPQSFLSMDTEGRVLRFDSFSKIMSSGLRLGFVTAPSLLLRQLELHVQVSTLHTSGLSQVIISKLIDKWGLDRLMENLDEVRKFYKVKRDHMLEACHKHLTGLAEWNVPSGGMFLWLKIKDIDDTYKLAMEDCIEKSLLIVPGHPFFMRDEDDCVYIRISYSLPSTEQMDEGCARLATIIRKRRIKS